MKDLPNYTQQTLVYDLHCHSTCSDGALAPVDLVERAIERGVNVLAITDHDTVAAYDQLDLSSYADRIRLIPGIEFSTVWNGVGVHIVGLNLNLTSDQLHVGVSHQIASREKRAEHIAVKLEKRGIKNALAGAKAIAGDAAVGRPHFAAYLVEQGLVDTIDQAFKRYLSNSKLGGLHSGWPDVADAVAWIKAANGVAVLAHPAKYNLTRTKLRRLLAEFKSAGGEAMEVISGPQDNNVTQQMTGLCREFELFGSCGSDFHTPAHTWFDLGRCPTLPDELDKVWDHW